MQKTVNEMNLMNYTSLPQRIPWFTCATPTSAIPDFLASTYFSLYKILSLPRRCKHTSAAHPEPLRFILLKMTDDKFPFETMLRFDDDF
jgi:hypothetical protein